MHIDIAEILFPNILKMITVLISTAIMFYFFYRFFWKSMRDYLEKRKEYVVGQVSEAAQSNKSALAYEGNASDALKQARIDSKRIVDRSRNEATKTKDKIISEAKAEANAQLESARLEMAREEVALRKSLEGEIADIALNAAREVVKDSIDQNKSEAIVDDFIKELNN